jgi:2,5-diketo-D-gluconate reductase A
LVPVLPLLNSAAPGMVMPATGLGTGGYAPPSSRLPSSYPECWDADANATVAAAVSSAVSTYIKMAISGGVAQARIDNADSYENVAAVGAGMRASGVPRENIWLLSKVGNGLAMGFQDTLDQFANICATQGVTYVDALLNHWPTATATSKEAACNAADPAYNATTCRLDTWRALVQIFNSGGAKAIGVSNYAVEQLEEIRLAGLPMPAINQIPIHIYRSSSWAETINYCLRHGIVVNSYSPLSVPDWHKFPAGNGMSVTALVDPVVTAVAAAHSRTPAAVILNWLWQLGFVSNPRTYNPAHMDDDLNAYNFALTPAEVAQLSARPQSWCSVDQWYECAPDTQSAPTAPHQLREVS